MKSGHYALLDEGERWDPTSECGRNECEFEGWKATKLKAKRG